MYFNEINAGLVSMTDPDPNHLNCCVNVYKYGIAYFEVVFCRIVVSGVIVVVSFISGAMHPSTLKGSRRVLLGKGGYN